jgi:hypothetical protein
MTNETRCPVHIYLRVVKCYMLAKGALGTDRPKGKFEFLSQVENPLLVPVLINVLRLICSIHSGPKTIGLYVLMRVKNERGVVPYTSLLFIMFSTREKSLYISLLYVSISCKACRDALPTSILQRTCDTGWSSVTDEHHISFNYCI